MAASITAGLTFKTEASMLKTIYLKSFSGKLMRAKNFILQVDNKIADAAEVSKRRKIRYKMSLLKDSVTE